MTTKHDVLAALQRHIGRRNGISAKALADTLGCDERSLRKIISELREEGTAVAAHPDYGYFMAETAEDLELCCAFLRARAMHSLHLEAQLRRIPLPDLLGQLKLRT